MTSVAISPDGRCALSGSFDHTLKLWDLATGSVLKTFSGPNDVIFCVAISPDGRSAISGGVESTLSLWDLNLGRESKTLSGHTDMVLSLALSPDGRCAPFQAVAIARSSSGTWPPVTCSKLLQEIPT